MEVNKIDLVEKIFNCLKDVKKVMMVIIKIEMSD